MNEKRKKKLQIKYKKHTAATEKNTTQARERKSSKQIQTLWILFSLLYFSVLRNPKQNKSRRKKVEIAEKK